MQKSIDREPSRLHPVHLISKKKENYLLQCSNLEQNFIFMKQEFVNLIFEWFKYHSASFCVSRKKIEESAQRRQRSIIGWNAKPHRLGSFLSNNIIFESTALTHHWFRWQFQTSKMCWTRARARNVWTFIDVNQRVESTKFWSAVR